MKVAAALMWMALPALAAQPGGPAPLNPSTASGSAGAAASVRVIQPLTIQARNELSFGSVGSAANCRRGGTVIIASKPGGQIRSGSPCLTLNRNGGETPLVRTLRGQPGQSYRITVPSSALTLRGGLTVNNFTLYSTTGRDVTNTRFAALDNRGTDTLQVGATLLMPFGTAAGTYTARIPVTLAYE